MGISRMEWLGISVWECVRDLKEGVFYLYLYHIGRVHGVAYSCFLTFRDLYWRFFKDGWMDGWVYG